MNIQLWAIALNVWRESVRDRVLHVLIGSGIFFMGLSLIMGQMAVGGMERVIQSMCFWVMGIWGLIAVIYIGSRIVKQEIKQKTVYLILSRPLNRITFLMGKYLGVCLVLCSLHLVLLLVCTILFMSKGIQIDGIYFTAMFFILIEWVLLASFSLFFAAFTSPILHNFFLVGVSFLGHWSNDLRIFSEKSTNDLLKVFLKTIYYILPNLESINFKAAAMYHTALPVSILVEGFIVFLLWLCTMLIASNLIFFRRKVV
ncbi:MAG: ABC transporter permease [Desulfobacterales bacterium]|nr:ABC transporter permease [Desulfobacterales bacterium]